MRYFLAIILFFGVFTAFAQKNKFKGAGFDYTKTAPNYIPVRGTESEIAIDSLTGKWMQYSYQSAEWWHLGYFVTETGTSGAPSYTPNKVKSVMAINAGDSLYHYRAGTWYLIAGGGGGAGITDGDKGDVDVTGGGTVWTIDTGAVTMIKINQDGAAVGQVIKWNGTSWAPANDNTLSAGAGGIYGPSDLVTYNHTSTLDSGLTFSSAEDTAYFNIIMAPGAFGSAAYFNSDSIRMRRYDVGGSNEVILNADGVMLKTTTPDRATIQGADARYAADYRATYSDRSLIDKKYGDDFYLQEVDSLRVSNDTLYISLARDSVPEKFVVLPASDDTSGYNLDFRVSNDTLYIEDADGSLFVDLEPYKDNTDTSGYNLGARISGDTLYIRDGDGEVSVELPSDSDGQTLSIDSVSLESGERFVITISNGNSVSFDVQADTDNQTLDTFDIVSNILRASLTDDGVPFKSVDLSTYLDNTDTSGYNLSFTRSNDTLYLTDGDGQLFVKLPADNIGLDTSGYNLDFRVSNDTLYIEDADGALFVGLEPYMDNTDTSGYNLSFTWSNDTLYLSDGDGTLFVKLPAAVATDTSGYNLQVRISGDTLYIRDGDGELSVSLAAYLDNTDGQTLSVDSTDIGGIIERFEVSISNGNSVYIDVPQVSGSGAGQNNVGANLGAGTVVYAGKTDTILQFKSLVEGYGIDLSNTSTEITIKADTAQVATSHDVAVVQGDINAHELADGDLDDTNELQSLTIDSVAITGKERFLIGISDGNTVAFDVDLNTDTQDISIDSAATTGGQNFTVTLQDGGDVDFFIPTNTDNQTLILDSAIVGSVERFELEVSNGNSVFFDIPQITDTDNQSIDTFTYSSGIITLSLQDDGLPAKTIDISGVNTDNQIIDTFEIVSDILRLSVEDDGLPFKSVDLSSYLDNTDAQNLSYTASSRSLEISGGTGISIPLFSQFGTNAGLVSGSNTATTNFLRGDNTWQPVITTEVDGSTTNEIQRLDTFEIVSNVLRASLLNDGLPFSSVSLSAYLDNTDNQTLDTFEIVSNILRASNFGDGVPFKSVDLSPYLDNTDTQDLSIDSTTIGSIERFTINLVGSPSISFDVSNTTGTVTSVAATQPAAGITISGSPITGSGTLTFALANDLAGLEGQSGTGIVVRTGDGTYAQRTATVFSSVASTANLAIGNANGVSGNPLISIETDHATSKLFVQAVSTTNLDLNGTETIDGVSVTNGQRVLVAGQTAQEDNGIWDVVSAGAWTRSTDANTSAKIDPGVLVNVKLGSTYGGTMWRLTTVGPYTLGSTDLVFEEVFKDEDNTNELQTIDTLSLSGTVMSLSLEGDGLPASTLDFAGIVGSVADVITLEDSAALKAYTGSATGVILKQAGRQGTFVRVSTTRAHDGFIVFTDGNGNKWQRIMDNVINVKWFGAKGDGVTDDTWTIQRAIDYSIYEDTLIKQVFIPSGNYVITKTIHLGYGNAYHSVSLIGDGAPTFRGEIGSFNGTMLSPTFSNSPALNIQGARYTTVENITLVGVNDIDGFLSDTSASNINNWLDSGLDAVANNQRTPYAGITIDGFSGTAPSPAYAHYAYPSYAGDTTQYNKDFSSQVKISKVGIHGFVAGIVLQPNSDGNGDFTQVEKCIIDRVAYGISVGNANSRNFKILDCYIDAHTGVTNSTHGNQTGRITLIQNNHFGGYQWFAFNNLPYLEGLEINNNYGESFYWLGSIGSVAGNQPTIVFNGCDFSMLATAQGTLQRFGDFIGSGAYVFNDCSFKNNRLYQFNNTNGAWIDFNECKFNADVFEGEPGDTVETYHDIFFRNMLFVVGTYPERIKVNKSRFAEYAETNSLAFPQQDGNGVSFPTNLTYTSYWLDRSNEGVDVQYKDLGYPGGYLGIASAFDTYAFSGRTFTGKVKTTYKHGIGEGDALFIRDGDVFLPCMITEIDAGDTITALLMADYKYNTTTGAFETAFGSTALSAANVQHISSRKFLNTRTITGTFTAGSTTVTDVKYVYDGTDAATNFEERTPLLNMDGLLNAQTSPVSNDTWIDSVLTSSSILLSEAAIRNGTFPIQNCFTGNGGDKTAIPVQQIVYGNGNDIKSEAAFLYDSTNNRIILNGTSGQRQITLNPKSGETTSSGGIRINSDGVADTDPVGRIEFVGNTSSGPYTQKGYIGFDISGSSAKGQALVFGLTTDGQSVLGTTALYENQLVVNNSNTFSIGNNTGRLEISGSTGIYSRDKTWLLGGSAYTTANANVRLKLAGDNSDTSTTKYGLQIYNGFNQSYFSARNDGNVILGGRTVASEFQILEASGSGTNYTGFKAQPMSADLMYTLPAAAGTAGQQLTWNASNILTWEDAGGSPVNIYTADGNVKDGGTIVDVSGNDPIILALDNATTEQNRMLRLTFDHTDDVTNTYGISFVGPNDSLEIRSYDSGMYLDYEGSGGGEGFVISSNTILDLRGDSILISTPPTRTILHHLLGIYNPMAPQTVSQIEGTANGDILVWNETGGYWEIGTTSGTGDGNGIYDGSGTIAPATESTLTASDYWRIKYDGGVNAIDINDVTETITFQSKTQTSSITVLPGSIDISADTVGQVQINVSNNSMSIVDGFVGINHTTGAKFRLYEPTASGSNYTEFTQPALSSNQTYALPVDAPNDGEVLTWNTTGQLSWETAGGGDVATDAIWDAKGDLAVGTGANTAAKLTVGANGKQIYADSGESTGLRWGPDVISPSQITSDQDDYAPTGWADAQIVRLDGDNGIRAITSMAAGYSGEIKQLINVGSYPIYFPGEHPDGTAANRIDASTDFILFPKLSARIMYDGTSSRWRILDSEGSRSIGKTLYYQQSVGSPTAADNDRFTWGNTAGSVGVSVPSSPRPARYSLSTVTSTTGHAWAGFSKSTSNEFSVFEDAHIWSDYHFWLDDLSDGTETYTVTFSISSDISASGAPNNTVGVRYSHGTNSGKFQGFSRDNSGSETTVDLGITVAADTQYTLRIEIDKSKTEARFYINNIMCGRVAANMPNAVNAATGCNILKSAGTTARILSLVSMSAGAIYP